MTSADDVAQFRDADLAMLSHTPWPMNLAVSTGASLARICEEGNGITTVTLDLLALV